MFLNKDPTISATELSARNCKTFTD